jgi:ribosomal protein S18 acetylase RimI-like enzyme
MMAWLTIAIELAGGAAVLAGAYVRLASIPMVVVLLVAVFTVHLPYGFSSIKLLAVTAAGPQFGPPGYEVAVLYIGGLAALAISGTGPFSVDRSLSRINRGRHSDETLERVAAGPGRDAFLPLLLLADDSVAHVRSYYQTGELFVLRGNRGVRGIALTVTRSDGTVELKAAAVPPELQGRGVGRRLVALTFDELRTAGVRRVIVGTAVSGVREIAFYQRLGFRPLAIERDFFNETRGYRSDLRENGIALRDIVWMDCAL